MPAEKYGERIVPLPQSITTSRMSTLQCSVQHGADGGTLGLMMVQYNSKEEFQEHHFLYQ